jgi:hypothetical protein
VKDDDTNNVILSLQNSYPIIHVTTVDEPQPRDKNLLNSNPKKQSTPLKQSKSKLPSFEEE